MDAIPATIRTPNASKYNVINAWRRKSHSPPRPRWHTDAHHPTFPACCARNGYETTPVPGRTRLPEQARGGRLSVWNEMGTRKGCHTASRARVATVPSPVTTLASKLGVANRPELNGTARPCSELMEGDPKWYQLIGLSVFCGESRPPPVPSWLRGASNRWS
jgi:hypothetical protein